MKAFKNWGRIALVCAILCMASIAALARSGGGETGAVAPPLIYDYTATINGTVPTWTGDCTITNSIPGYYSFSVLNLNIKVKQINLPDRSVLHITAYMSDKLTGQSLAPVSVASALVIGKSSLSKTNTASYYVGSLTSQRQLDKVVITTDDGTVIATAHL